VTVHAGALRVRVAGTGSWIPPRVETAADLAPRLGVTEEWILTRTGVRERRISDLPMEEMAAHAARAALGGGAPPDLLVNASLTPVQLAPDGAVFILRALGLSGVPGFSVHATCLSFLDALPMVGAMVHAGGLERALLVSAERGSLGRDLGEPESAALIGDGAGAVVLEPAGDSDSAILGWAMGTWPDGADLAEIRGFGQRRLPDDPATTPADHRFHMRGPRLYRAALRHVIELLDELFGRLGLTRDDIDLVVPHQASGPAVAALGRLGFPPERVVDVVAEYGNCIAASVPMALARADADGRLRRGDTVLLVGTGAGLGVTAVVLRW
jgi:3-oxoacyl-[acyl-carrier-protein] synthase-3